MNISKAHKSPIHTTVQSATRMQHIYIRELYNYDRQHQGGKSALSTAGMHIPPLLWGRAHARGVFDLELAIYSGGYNLPFRQEMWL